MTKLSARLSRLADLVTEGSRLADVGTDHAYVPIYLCETGRIPSAIAMDINAGPLKRAVSHIDGAGLSARIDTRLSDGLSALEKGEADTILIAGMGGALIERILEDGKDRLEGACELVLQPQSEAYKVRSWLLGNGWIIADEDIVLDEGKYYPMFRAERLRGRPQAYTKAEYYFGRAKIQRTPKVWNEYLHFRLGIDEDILGRLGHGSLDDSPAKTAKRSELEKEIEMIRDRLEAVRKGVCG